MRYAKVNKQTGQVTEIVEEGGQKPKEDDQFSVIEVGANAQVGDQMPTGQGQGQQAKGQQGTQQQGRQQGGQGQQSRSGESGHGSER